MKTVRHPDGYEIQLHPDGRWERVEQVPLAASAPDDIAAFRGVRWGATLEQVKASRPAEPLHEGESAIQFEGSLNNEPIIELFIFHDGRLARGKCISTANYVNDNNYLRSFSALKDLLTEKYGQPNQDAEYWSNDLFKDDPDSWGTALASGHLSRFVQWAKPSGDVWLALKGENYEVEFELEYNSAAMQDEVNAAMKQARLDEI